jgi:choline kinase
VIPAQAVILAAGRGTRLGGLGHFKPKGFLEVGDLPIIEESLGRLFGLGVDQVLIVTGHCADHYRELASRYGTKISVVHNQKYADSGSLFSLLKARPSVAGRGFLLLESDLIYDTRILEVAAKDGRPDLLLTSEHTGSGDEVWVGAEDGILRSMSKEAKGMLGQLHGEFVGISKVSPELLEIVADQAARWFRKSLHVEYEQGLVAASQRRGVCCLSVGKLPWSEIDSEEHLARARREIYPRIQSLSQTGLAE